MSIPPQKWNSTKFPKGTHLVVKIDIPIVIGWYHFQTLIKRITTQNKRKSTKLNEIIFPLQSWCKHCVKSMIRARIYLFLLQSVVMHNSCLLHQKNLCISYIRNILCWITITNGIIDNFNTILHEIFILIHICNRNEQYIMYNQTSHCCNPIPK